MSNDLVFKTGWAKQALGWLVFLGAGTALVALAYAFYTHRETQTAADLWSGVAIGLFLIAFMVGGIAIQYVRWSIHGETIVFRHLFRSKTIPVSGLAGFGQRVIVVAVFPLMHIDLFDRDLKPVVRLPLGIKDWPKAEAWLAARLRFVADDGSVALPRRRFADTPKR